jgi:hypothetical protein
VVPLKNANGTNDTRLATRRGRGDHAADFVAAVLRPITIDRTITVRRRRHRARPPGAWAGWTPHD